MKLRRSVIATLLVLTFAACAAWALAAVQFKGGDEGNLWVDTRGRKQGVLLVRKNGAVIAEIAVPRARWEKFVTTWHKAENVPDDGVWRLVAILKMGQQRLELEAGKSVKLTFIGDQLSHTFTIDREDYAAFSKAVDDVLDYLVE